MSSNPCFWPLGPPDSATLALVHSGAYLSKILNSYYEFYNGKAPPVVSNGSSSSSSSSSSSGTHMGMTVCPIPELNLNNLKKSHVVGIFVGVASLSAFWHYSRKPNRQTLYKENTDGKKDGTGDDLVDIVQRTCHIFEKLCDKSQYICKTGPAVEGVEVERDRVLLQGGLSAEMSIMELISYVLGVKSKYGLFVCQTHLRALEGAVRLRGTRDTAKDPGAIRLPSEWLPTLAKDIVDTFTLTNTLGETHLRWLDLQTHHSSSLLDKAAGRAAADSIVLIQEFIEWLFEELVHAKPNAVVDARDPNFLECGKRRVCEILATPIAHIGNASLKQA